MWYRSLGVSRMITALMLLTCLAPQNVCLPCTVSSMISSTCESHSCDCVHDLGESTDGLPDKSPRQQPGDDSKCPYCIAMSLGAVLSQPMETHLSSAIVTFFASEQLDHSVPTKSCLNVGSLRPPAAVTQHFHTRL